MQLHLAFDGGGSKLAAIVYDDNFNFVARRRAGGTNARFLGDERVAQNCEEAIGGALDEAFAKTGKYPADAAGVVVGPSAPCIGGNFGAYCRLRCQIPRRGLRLPARRRAGRRRLHRHCRHRLRARHGCAASGSFTAAVTVRSWATRAAVTGLAAAELGLPSPP